MDPAHMVFGTSAEIGVVLGLTVSMFLLSTVLSYTGASSSTADSKKMKQRLQTVSETASFTGIILSLGSGSLWVIVKCLVMGSCGFVVVEMFVPQVMLLINTRDQQQAQLTRAKLDLQTIKSQAAATQQEYFRLMDEIGTRTQANNPSNKKDD